MLLSDGNDRQKRECPEKGNDSIQLLSRRSQIGRARNIVEIINHTLVTIINDIQHNGSNVGGEEKERTKEKEENGMEEICA